MTQSAPSFKRSNIVALSIRSVWHLLAIITLTLWGLLTWSFPMPSILISAGVLVLSVLLWALFLSPRPMLRTDRFAQSLIELVLLACAVAALLTLGANWIVAALFGVIGAVLGFFAGKVQE